MQTITNNDQDPTSDDIKNSITEILSDEKPTTEISSTNNSLLNDIKVTATSDHLAVSRYIKLTPNGQIITLFLNNCIERVFLHRTIDPYRCSFIPIFNQVVIVSDVEPGILCYAKLLETAEKGYKILTMPMNNESQASSATAVANIPSTAVRGFTFDECCMSNADVRRKYREHRRAMRRENNNNNNNNEKKHYKNKITSHFDGLLTDSGTVDSKRPKLFMRYGDRELGQQTKTDVNYRLKLRQR